MQSQDVAQRHAPSAQASGPVIDVEQAEAALVEHYPRLVRIAYLVLPPGLGRSRRVLTAHALVQRALPRGRTSASVIPSQSTGRDSDPGYSFVRLQVVRTALEAGLPLKRRAWPKRSQLPPLLPQVWGLRLFPRSGGADELALDQRLAALSGPARAAYVLRGPERLADPDVRRVLAAAGAADPDAALTEANGVPAQYALLDSPEFDPCSLQARPTDLMRRRQHTKAAIAAAVALAVCGVLVALPGGWGPDGAAAPAYAKNPAAEAALDPGKLVRAAPTAWKSSSRTDFSVWPARGPLVHDSGLLRRALAVWARPGESVHVSATPGTQTGGPAGPPRLLYAGEVDNVRVVILYDGLRIARYAEPKSDGAKVAVLDLARVDGATDAEASAIVAARSDDNVRYLTAPWVTKAAERDLTKPSAGAMDLDLTDGITAPLAGPALRSGACTSWNALELTDASGTRIATDLGELVPAQLTTGRPGVGEAPSRSGAETLATWAPFACSLAAQRSAGVRSVNAWAYADQALPEATGTAEWVCTRAETWRGDGTSVLAQFHTPGGRYGAVAARAKDVAACGPRDPHVLAGVLWKSEAGSWYLLAAAGRDTESIRATGGISASVHGRLLTARAKKGARAELAGTLDGGAPLAALR
ncbi:hypothetical protein ACJ6WF_10985 [Streptomyces sp. MMS24-I2-30]|uniref:hypothetical protein n=1 Tax=Streptomyces sp. MMS24-I2-30 TaxID=3351564 RepID=UPI0038968D18